MALIKFVNPATRYKWFNLLWMLAMIAFPILLWMIPSDSLDDTGLELCPSKAFFDIECFGCGLTRATLHLHHFEWQDALYYNWGIVIVYPALVLIWIGWFKKAWVRHQRFNKVQQAR
jgi:hypothetical protein